MLIKISEKAQRYIIRTRIETNFEPCQDDFFPMRPTFTISEKLFVLCTVQGGSDKSGTLSKLHHRSKNNFFKLIFSLKTVSSLLRSGNKNKQILSSIYQSTGSCESCHSLQASRRAYRGRDYEHEAIKRRTVQVVMKES
jgi:hypothetical protein